MALILDQTSQPSLSSFFQAHPSLLKISQAMHGIARPVAPQRQPLPRPTAVRDGATTAKAMALIPYQLAKLRRYLPMSLWDSLRYQHSRNFVYWRMLYSLYYYQRGFSYWSQ